MSTTTGGVENPNKDKTIKNGVLCVIVGWFDSSTKINVINEACKSFLIEDLEIAKAALCNDSEVVGAIKGRNGTTPKSLMDDLYKCWKSLNDKNQMPQFIMDSSDVTKLPMLNPDECSIEVTAEKVKNLETLVTNLLSYNTTMSEQLEKIQGQLDKLSTVPGLSSQVSTAQTGSRVQSWAERSRPAHPGIDRARSTSEHNSRSVSPGKRRRGDNGDSIPVFNQQQKRGFQANNSRISDNGQLVGSFRTIFSVEHAPIGPQAETSIFGPGIA